MASVPSAINAQNILINAKPIQKESSKISNVKNMYCDQYGNAVDVDLR